MKQRQGSQDQYGFTIIEVVLVLAIAGLIFLIVFLALPSLQRAQRDTDRKKQVEQVLAAASNFATNNGGRFPCSDSVTTSRCETDSATWAPFRTSYLVPTKMADPVGGLREFTCANNWRGICAYGTFYSGAGLSDWFVTNYNPGIIVYAAGARCVDGKLNASVGGTNEIAAWIKLEGGGGHCVQN